MGDTPAWVTFTAIGLTGAISIVGNQLLERYKARNAAASAERDARRGYEYEARKRLYTAAEPLLFQLYEHAGNAVERIADLAKRSGEGHLGPDGWLTDNWRYYRTSTFYNLLAPGAAFWLLRERITFLDLSLDPVLEFQYKVAFAAYETWSADFALARQAPRIAYDPNADQHWQGILPGDRERPLHALFVGDGEASRIMTYIEFEDAYDQKTSRLRKEIAGFIEIFEGFTPASHPVLWRVLVAQYFVYRALRIGRARYRTVRSDQRRRPDATSLLSPQSILEAASESASGDLTYGASEDDRSTGDVAVKLGRRYLAHTLCSEASYYACQDCKRCDGDAVDAVAHGV
jgi:hypothetical protein